MLAEIRVARIYEYISCKIPCSHELHLPQRSIHLTSNNMIRQSRAYPICILCIWVLVPCTVYAMIANLFLLSTGRTDSIIRPNSALSLTTSFLTMTFIISWMLAIGNNLSRVPPPSGKKAAFIFLLMSTVFWFASLWTSMQVAIQRPTCREGASALEEPAPWSDGISCRMHRIGAAFSALGLIACLVILSSMIEISDRAFGGISTQAKLHWTTEKFREALIEIAEISDVERGECSRVESINSEQIFAGSSPAPSHISPPYPTSDFEAESVGRAITVIDEGEKTPSTEPVTVEEEQQRKRTKSKK